MNCLLCKGDMSEATTTFTVTLEHTIIVIKNVPCLKCGQCGEEVFPFEVTRRLETIIDGFKESASEISIINYSAA